MSKRLLITFFYSVNLTYMTTIRDNLQTIGARIAEYSKLYQRSLTDVQLLAVSKKHPIKAIQEAYD